MWMLIGSSLGLLYLYKKKDIDFIKDLKTVLISTPALLIYLLLISFIVYWKSITNYFVGDDFTWLRWAAECRKNLSGDCLSVIETVKGYFVDADGFFYRPGTKLYFLFMYTFFWLNNMTYHIVSIVLHFINSFALLLLTLRLLKSKLLAFLAAVVFLTLSVHAETVMWISSVNHLAAVTCISLSLILLLYWHQKKNILLLLASLIFVFLSPLFHELGIVAPIIFIGIDFILREKSSIVLVFKRWYYYVSLLQIPLYLFLRSSANSHWMQGDYSYNLAEIHYNIFGNLLGYLGLILVGNNFLSFYTSLREFGKTNPLIVLVSVVVTILLILTIGYLFKKRNSTDLKPYFVGLFLFITPLLPFLALGNIAFRYSYLASFGVIIIIFAFINSRLANLKKSLGNMTKILILLIISVFIYVQLNQLYKAGMDWKKAGQVTYSLVASFSQKYGGTQFQNPVFYFVNVPIRLGTAWIFPVGLEDAVYFTLQNEHTTVIQAESIESAFKSAEGSSSARVFEFDQKGNLEKVEIVTPTPPVTKK